MARPLSAEATVESPMLPLGEISSMSKYTATEARSPGAFSKDATDRSLIPSP